MRLSEHFGLNLNQSHLDFVDIPLDTDIQLFIDPYAVATAGTTFSNRCHKFAKAFFQNVLDKLRSGEEVKANELLIALREDNRTHLGYSKSESNGTGMGPDKARQFLKSLKETKAFHSGQIDDIDELALFVERVDRDIISDMMTNVLRAELVQYTQDQCALYGIPLAKGVRTRIWIPETGWTITKQDLPMADGKAVILVPRAFVRRSLALNTDTYITSILDQIDTGIYSGIKSLSKMLQLPVDKKGKLLRGESREQIKEIEPTTKQSIGRLSTRHSLDEYKKNRRKKQTPLSARDIDEINSSKDWVSDHDIISEMLDAARNAPEIWDAIRKLTGLLINSLHPNFQYPRMVSIDNMSGVSFENISTQKLFATAKRKNPRVLFLAASKRVDEKLIHALDTSKMLTESDSGALFIVGSGLDPKLSKHRTALGKQGVVLTTFAELGNILETDLPLVTKEDQLAALFRLS